jgi:hypothetical protein
LATFAATGRLAVSATRAANVVATTLLTDAFSSDAGEFTLLTVATGVDDEGSDDPAAITAIIATNTPAYIATVLGWTVAFLRFVTRFRGTDPAVGVIALASGSCFRVCVRMIILLSSVLLQRRLPYFVFLLSLWKEQNTCRPCIN